MARDPEGKALLAATISVIGTGTVAYALLENWSPLDSLYFSVVTLATVGFGDFHPTTEAGKAFTILYILSGLGILAAFISELTKYRASPTGHRIARHASQEPAGDSGSPVSGSSTAAADGRTQGSGR